MTEIVDALNKRLSHLMGERGTWEYHWQEIADFVLPRRGDFQRFHTPGQKRDNRLFDSTAAMACEHLASGLYSMMTNPAQDWFELRPEEDELAELEPVQSWLETVQRRMYATFASRGSRFYARVHELYVDLAAFGTACFYVEDQPGQDIYFSTRHLGEIFVAQNGLEQIDTVFRRWNMSARGAAGLFGIDKVSPKVRDAVEKKPDQLFPFAHAVMPRDDHQPGRRDAKGKAFASYYFEPESQHLISEGGYDAMPYQVPRWFLRSGETYGRSPGMTALADVKMLNRMSQTTLKAAQKVIDPPLLVADDGVLLPLDANAGGIIMGGLREEGDRIMGRVQPLPVTANVGLGLEMEQQRRLAIREVFHFSMLQLQERPNMTATEILAHQDQMLRQMGPHLGRIQTEFLDPLIDRVFSLLVQRPGALPPPPEELQGQQLKIEYVSPLARAQKATEGQAIARSVELIAPFSATDPTMMDHFDTDEIARYVPVQIFGAPSRILRSREKVEAIRKARQEAEEAAAEAAETQAAASTGATVAGAARDLSQAGAAGARA